MLNFLILCNVLIMCCIFYFIFCLRIPCVSCFKLIITKTTFEKRKFQNNKAAVSLLVVLSWFDWFWSCLFTCDKCSKNRWSDGRVCGIDRIQLTCGDDIDVICCVLSFFFLNIHFFCKILTRHEWCIMFSFFSGSSQYQSSGMTFHQ